MSLTVLLENSEPLRQKLRATFKIPPHALAAEMVAPPISKSYPLVGTAVDYLLRFKVKHINGKRLANADDWIADKALGMLHGHLLSLGSKKVGLGRMNKTSVSAERLLESLAANHKAAKKHVSAYLKSGKTTDDLIESAIFLARLDAFYRAGFVDPGLLERDADVLQDTRSVFLQAQDEHFTVIRSCYLNPTFGKGSRLVGGADADLILDDMLVDIKTTMHLRLDRSYFDQLLCYYVLSLIGGINGSTKNKSIKKVGIYYSRHGLMWSAAISDLGSDEEWKDFKKWFIDHLKQHPWWIKTTLACA